MGVNPKIGVGPPDHPFVHRVFPYFHHPFWGQNPTIFGSTPIALKSWELQRFLWASHRIKEDVGMERKNEKQIIALKDLWARTVFVTKMQMNISYQIHCKWLTCCWWLKSCTTWDVWNPIPQLVSRISAINSVTYIPNRAPAPLWTCTKTSPYWASSHAPRSPTQSMPRLDFRVLHSATSRWFHQLSRPDFRNFCFKKKLLCFKKNITGGFETNILWSLRPPPYFHTVDGWNPANQLIGSLSHYL